MALLRRGSLAIAVWLVAGLSFLAVAWPAIVPLDDRTSLRWERMWRLAWVRFGYDLPGTPDYTALDQRLQSFGASLGSPMLIRIFKREFELEVWLAKNGRFEKFETYPICRWSGQLGPKVRQGDHQAPEGFYTVAKSSLNPNSRWHRSFNLGFPNTLDRAHGRTGTFLMVHGGCSSIGCYAMTNDGIDEIWRLMTSALAGQQSRIQVQAYPFRMTEVALAAAQGHPQQQFWRDLKAGHDLFAATGLPPTPFVCNGAYRFTAAAVYRASAPDLESRCPQGAPPPTAVRGEASQS